MNKMRKTLGGERLGVGNKLKVDLHGYERSTFNLSRIWRNTMATGTLVPFFCEVAQMGDTWDIDLNAVGYTHPTIGPLFGSIKAQFDVFIAPIRLYQGQLHNNKLGVGRAMKNVKLPIITLSTGGAISESNDIDNCQVNPSCILKYLGISGVGDGGGVERYRDFNGVPYLVYVDIYKNYYANKMEEKGAVIHQPKRTIETKINRVSINNDTAPIYIDKYPKAGNPNWVLPDVIDETLWVEMNAATVNYQWDQLMLIITTDNPVTNANPTTYAYKALDLYRTVTPYGAGNTMFKLSNFNSAKLIDFTGAYAFKGWRYADASELMALKPQITTFPLSHIDDMRESILAWTQNPAPFSINGANKMPYNLLLTEDEYGWKPRLASQEGLLLKTYLSDINNNWLNTEWIDGATGINEITAVDVSSGKLKIDALILARKVYDMMNRIAVSGGSYDDWLEVVYDHEPLRKASNPMYMGGMSKELTFQEVISNSASIADGVSQPLGTLAGRGTLQSHQKGGKVTIKVDEPSYIMGIASLTPRIDYSQGNSWDVNLKTMDDFYKPALGQIGFQELITDQIAWWDTTIDNDGVHFRSAGKQPAWINYMTAVNQIRGNFAVQEGVGANGEMFMVFNRRYERDKATGRIKDLTTYIDPTKFNHIFAQTSIDAMNYWIQIGIEAYARRKMSAKVMPNL